MNKTELVPYTGCIKKVDQILQQHKILHTFGTLLLISHVYKTLCLSFEAFRAVKLIQQIAVIRITASSKGLLFIDTPYSHLRYLVWDSQVVDVTGWPTIQRYKFQKWSSILNCSMHNFKCGTTELKVHLER